MAAGASSAASTGANPLRALRPAGGAIALALGLSGLAAGIATVVHAAWFAVAFEAMIAIAGALGLLWSLRKPKAETALAILYVAGTIFVASVLAWLGAGRMLGGVSLTPLLAARLGACAAMIAVAGAIHVADKPDWALPRVGLGLILVALPSAAIAALWLAPALRAQLTSLHPVAAMAGATLAFVIVVGALSAGAHLLITAFEPNTRDAEPAPADAPG